MRCLMSAWCANESSLKAWLIKQTGNQAQAEDLLQDLFIKAMQHKDIFCSIDDAKSWLFKVAHNSFIDQYRKSKRYINTPEIEIEDQPKESTTPLTGLQQCMSRVLFELDEDDKDIIEMCDIQGVSQNDYAKLKEISLTATKSRIQRARKKLRQQMVSACQVKFEGDKVCCFTPRK